MSTAQLSMIAPPPSVAAVLGALTEETRIGQVDFTTRLAPEPEPKPAEGLEGYDEVVTLGDDAEPDLSADEPEESAAPTAEIVSLVSVPDLPDHEDEVETPDEPETAPVTEPAATEAGEPEPSIDADERPPTVEEIARLVVERMHDAELAMMRHLDAIEVETARRSELLTAQAELDAELIRLNARREAHAIVTAARVRAGEPPTVSAEERRLDELTESLSRFAEVFDELRPAGTPSVPWGRTP